jgi:hypothetical protein
MKNRFNQKVLTLINLTIASFFMSIYLIDLYKIDHVLIGVFRELLTLPFLIAQLVFLFFGIKFIMQQKTRHFLMLFSVVALAVSTFITIGGFF